MKTPLEETLRHLAGHLVVETDEERRRFKSLHEALAASAPPEDPRRATGSDFSIARSDLFFEETIPRQRRETLDALAGRIRSGETGAAEYRVFAREVPIREPLLYASVPGWAAGARAARTIGPFEHADGRRLWFDFYRVIRLTRLFVQGTAGPVLLFPAARRQGRGRGAATYALSAGTVWIRARVLAPAAPADHYVGVRMQQGRVIMDAEPSAEGGDLTAPASVRVQVELTLDTTAGDDGDGGSPYGEDARRLQLEMPGRVAFHFSALDRGIDEVGDAGWELHGQTLRFSRSRQGDATWDPALGRVVLPMSASEPRLRFVESHSPMHAVRGEADIVRSGWALAAAAIDTSAPPEADGTGAMLVEAGAGIGDRWSGLESGPLHLAHPMVLAAPGSILLADLAAGNPHARHELDLWRDETNPFGSTVVLTFPSPVQFFYATTAAGVEVLMTAANAHVRIDRPVQVDGAPPDVRSRNSLLVVAASAAGRLIYLFDDNLLQDAASGGPEAPRTLALALTNALFTVSRPNGCLLFGTLDEAFVAVENGVLFLTFGLHAYLPTLPDPYAANLGVLARQIRGTGATPSATRGATARAALSAATALPVTAWLVCRVRWEPPAAEDELDRVTVSFHFAPLGNQFGGISLDQGGTDSQAGDADAGSLTAAAAGTTAATAVHAAIGSAVAVHNRLASDVGRVATSRATARTSGDAPATAAATSTAPPPDYGKVWDAATGRLSRNLFALLDVSTNADLYGVSFDLIAGRDPVVTTHVPVPAAAAGFPLQVSGMDVVSAGRNVKAFTVPQISWEPLINLSQAPLSGDPPPGFNYYPNDGGPTQLLNNSPDSVALAPLPVAEHLVGGFEADPDHFVAWALMTLPFGMKALAVLQDQFSVTLPDNSVDTRPGTELRVNAETFEHGMKGGLQLQLDAGEAFIDGESDMFVGSTLQLNNVLDALGTAGGASTLGETVTKIFNNEFLLQPFDPFRQRGVPLSRIDLSGYGASTFSNWLNPAAAFAETSQARFDVFVGRCAHEVVQVRSIVYPWGIRVVRTITIFRVGSGYVYRHDSGWQAESAGRFDFRYWVNLTPDTKAPQDSPFRIHPGVVRGLHNVQNIIETEEIAVASGSMVSPKMVDGSGLWVGNPAPGDALGFELQPVWFDADVAIEGLVSGFRTKPIDGASRDVVPSKRILGYVQVAPRGIPITEGALRDLVALQLGSIGGPIDCEVDLAGSGQTMRLSRFDFNNSFGANGSDIVFAVAGRGSVLLPKEGSWTMVKHERDTGEVTPVPANLSVPVIRRGMLIRDRVGELDTPPADALLRIANPTELLRAPVDDTLNFGLLQSTDTQKALFLTPAFEMGQAQLFSKSPPLFVDAFRIVNSKSIFPNVGDGESNLGEAISLVPNGTEFLKGALQDGGTDVWRLMDISASAENAAAQGFQLLKEVATFDLPDTEFELIDVGDGNFRIYIEYEQKDADGNQQSKGDLDFNIDSMAADVAETWKSRMGNIGLVVDLAGISRLMTIRGNWDSKKGAGTNYPQPELVFADELKPIIDILEILQKLQGGDYAGAVANGLKLAMSNKAGTWEYKFEASKEIPVLRFPVPDAAYNDPNAPFKLECGLTLGAYFNAAIKVTTDANELLPSAGGHLGFYGRLSVMCVSVSAATIYAIGQVNLDIAADTKIGPSLRMKFGFGAQIVIGLPVAGNVSVLFVVGVEIFAASGIVEVTAFMLFEGHAEILGGIVSITIRIEAKGTVSKKAIGGGSRTDLVCQVTFSLEISIFLVININAEWSWSEQRRIAD